MSFPFAVFLINLESRPDRLTEASERLAAADVEFERLQALTPDVAESAGISVCVPKNQASWLEVTPGNHGCAASHMQVYRMIVERNLPGALVLEDDLVLEHDFKARLLRGWNVAHGSSHLIQFGSIMQRPSRWKGRAFDAARAISGFGPRDRLVYSPFGFGTHCYWVDADFAAAALRLLNPVFAPIDVMLKAYTHYGGWQCQVHWPSLALQSGSASDIRPGKVGIL